MIQRKQTLWLLLAIVANILTYFLPVYSGTRTLANSSLFENLTAGSTFSLLILTGVIILLTLVTIFLYKNRKLQIIFCIIALLLSLGNIALYYFEISGFNQGNVSLYGILLFIPVLSYLFAIKGIRNDEKLIKSLDRLR